MRLPFTGSFLPLFLLVLALKFVRANYDDYGSVNFDEDDYSDEEEVKGHNSEFSANSFRQAKTSSPYSVPTLNNCGHICGKIPEPREANPSSKTSSTNSTHHLMNHVRIVNGYVPRDKRPWQTLILTFGSLCGGAIINRRFVLTAAHCVCNMNPKHPAYCKSKEIEGKDTMVPDYDFKRGVTVILGVNYQSLDYVKRHQENIYYPESIRNSLIYITNPFIS